MRFNLFKTRKAQSATEYLMTYGWAILAIAIVGALLYTQVFSANRCAEGATGFALSGQIAPDGNEYTIDPTSGNLQILMKNSVGKDITVTTVDCAGTNIDIADVVIADGAKAVVPVAACATGTADACYSVPVVFHYQSSAAIDLKAGGTLNGKY